MEAEFSVSVIIPSYNRPEYAIRAVRTVSRQTVKPHEMIVVNDGSDVDYVSVEEELDSLPIETEYIRTENQGASQARNTGAERATGDIYMFLDDDDQWLPQKIENQLQKFSDNSNVGLVYSAGVLVSENGETIHYVNPGKEGDLSNDILLKNHVGSTSGAAVKKDLFEKVNGFDPELPALQDYDLWIRICQKTLVSADRNRTILWTRHEETQNQITGNPDRYINGLRTLRKKHKDKYGQLSHLARRRAKARQFAAISDRYSNASSKTHLLYAMGSLLYYPTLRGFTELFPDEFIAKLRKLANR